MHDVLSTLIEIMKYCQKSKSFFVFLKIQGPQRQNVKSNMPIVVHNTDFLAIKMVLVHF